MRRVGQHEAHLCGPALVEARSDATHETLAPDRARYKRRKRRLLFRTKSSRSSFVQQQQLVSGAKIGVRHQIDTRSRALPLPHFTSLFQKLEMPNPPGLYFDRFDRNVTQKSHPHPHPHLHLHPPFSHAANLVPGDANSSDACVPASPNSIQATSQPLSGD